MHRLIRREFDVNVPLQTAWDYLAHVEQWPSWAKHIKRVRLNPPGELTPHSEGDFYLSGGIQSRFKMVEYHPGRNWKWVGPFLGLTVHYDHQFFSIDEENTQMVWTVSAEGFGSPIFGRLFAAIYNRNLNRAIPNLVAEMNSIGR